MPPARAPNLRASRVRFSSQVARAIAMNVGMMATYDVSKGAIIAVNGDNFGSQVGRRANGQL